MVLDVVVDVRVGSPSYARWEAVRLDDERRRAVFLSEGLGHSFTALTAEATVIYLCSTPYAPGREHGVHPLDPDIRIERPVDTEPVLSPKDAAAPTLEERAARGCCRATRTARPTWVACARRRIGELVIRRSPLTPGGPLRGEESGKGAVQRRAPLADGRNARPRPGAMT